MVFDEDLHGDRFMPLYFLRKLYVEFILHKHVNYFDILKFQGVGKGMPHDREHARANPNQVRPPPCPQNPPWLYPLAHNLFFETLGALLQLSQTLVYHSTFVKRDAWAHLGCHHLVVREFMVSGSHPTVVTIEGSNQVAHVQGIHSLILAHHVVASTMVLHQSFPSSNSLTL